MLKEIRKVIGPLRTHYVLLVISCILDLLFFYCLTRLHVEIFRRAGTHIKATQTIIENQMEKLANAEYAHLDSFLINNADFAYQYHHILKYLGLFLALLFLIWILLRGTNWLLAHKIANTKITLKEFSKRFIILSIAGFAVLLIILLSYGQLLNYATFNPLPLINTTAANGLLVIMIAILYYFLSVGLALPCKTRIRDIKKGITNAQQLAPTFALISISLAILFTIPAALMNNHYQLGLAFALLITTPSLTFARIYFIKSVRVD